VGLKLYHALSQQFNDSFKCKPHWRRPENAIEVTALRSELYNIAKRQGESNKGAEQYASNSMGSREETEKLIQDTITENYQKICLCSFPTLNENILLWSHYANSHKELCIAFATNTLPFVACLKVKYQDGYPYLELTITGDSRAFKSVLTKSRSWTYKNEYRSILYPTTENQHPNDGEAYFFLQILLLN
tara:strand:+ start:304 stop:870 length:567 start_codon:yes stop_codon:yes gene_type:complete